MTSAPWTYLAGLAGALCIVAALVWAMQHYTRPKPLGQDRAAERRKNLAELRQADAATLTHYAWQDQAKGLVRLPISNAMDVVVREYQDPAAARAKLAERADKAAARPPEKPSEFE